MPKIGMEPIRRQQIIDATISCVHEEGLARTTLQRIAKRAGLTSGLIVHYFDDKQGLFDAVYRCLNKRLYDDTANRLRTASSPLERLQAIVEAQLSLQHMRRDVAVTWLALASKINEMPTIRRIERMYEKRLRSNLMHALKGMSLAPQSAEQICHELMSLIDGLWLNSVAGIHITPGRSRYIMRNYLAARLPLN